MVKTKDSDNMNSNMIVSEVQKRPCLYDTNDPAYGDRAEKKKCWEEVCESVVRDWSALPLPQKFTVGKEVQKRWRSIRDSYTKAYRQGKCVAPEQCTAGSRRYNYHKQMSFLLRALQNKKPRYSQDKYESYSEISNSPQHITSEDAMPKMRTEFLLEKPLDLKTRPNLVPETSASAATCDKSTSTSDEDTESIDRPVDMSMEANGITPQDHFKDDNQFMNSLLPLFKKMSDDTRLLCRIEVLKIIRYALQGHKKFEAFRMAEDSTVRTVANGVLKEMPEPVKECGLAMTTRSADGSRPVRKRKTRSPSPPSSSNSPPVKRRGPGRPRKVRPQRDSDEERVPRKRVPRMRVIPVQPIRPELTELEQKLLGASSITQLSESLFLQVLNLVHIEPLPISATDAPMKLQTQVSVKIEKEENEVENNTNT